VRLYTAGYPSDSLASCHRRRTKKLRLALVNLLYVYVSSLDCFRQRQRRAFSGTNFEQVKVKDRSRSRTGENENALTLVMIVVVLVFIACQSPARLVQLIWRYSFTDCRQVG